MTEGNLDTFWPDFPGSRRHTWADNGWNTADVDEMGPIGLFALTVNGLSANTEYTFSVRPIFYPHPNTLVKAVKEKTKTKASGKNVCRKCVLNELPKQYDYVLILLNHMLH